MEQNNKVSLISLKLVLGVGFLLLADPLGSLCLNLALYMGFVFIPILALDVLDMGMSLIYRQRLNYVIHECQRLYLLCGAIGLSYLAAVVGDSTWLFELLCGLACGTLIDPLLLFLSQELLNELAKRFWPAGEAKQY